MTKRARYTLILGLALTAAAFAKNLFFVTIGNAAGGAIFVALFYFLIFRKELTKA